MAISKDKCIIALKDHITPAQVEQLQKADIAGDQEAWGTTIETILEDFDAKRSEAKLSAVVELRLRTNTMKNLNTDTILKKLDDQLKNKNLSDKKRLKLKLKRRKRRRVVADEIATSHIGRSYFMDKGNVSVYSEELTTFNKLISGMITEVNKNEGAFGRYVRTMTDDVKRDLARSFYGGKNVKTKGALEIAKASENARNHAIILMQNKGSRIQPIPDFGLSNSYTMNKLSKVSEKEFVKDMMEGDFIIHDNPDIKNPKYIPSEEPQRFYTDIYRNVTAGLGDAIEGVTILPNDKIAMAHRNSGHRYIYSKSGDTWFDHAKKYGDTDNPLEATYKQLSGMSHQIAMLGHFGPDPVDMWNGYIAGLRKMLNDDSVGIQADSTFRNLTTADSDSESTWIRVAQGVQGIQSGGMLGFAFMSAVTDTVFAAGQAVSVGISPFRVLTRHFVNLATGKSTKLAQEMGIIAHHSAQMMGDSHRFADASKNQMIRKTVNFMLKASGLNRITDSMKASFGLEFLNNVAKLVEGGKFNPQLVRTFERFGIDESMLKNLPIVERDGLRLIDVARLDSKTADPVKHLLAMTSDLTRIAAPEPGMSMRNVLTFGTQRGTLPHESLKILTQFMSFPLTVAYREIKRLTDHTVPLGSRLGYAGAMFLGTASLGTLIVQGKQLAKGNPLFEWDDPKFLLQAITQGGSMGFVTDMFFSQYPLFGSPTMRDMNNMRRFMFQPFVSQKDFDDAAKEWFKNLTPAALHTADRLTGFATNLWYTKLVWERLIKDPIYKWASPSSYRENIKNKDTFLKRTNRPTKSWWDDGEYLPEFLQ